MEPVQKSVNTIARPINTIVQDTYDQSLQSINMGFSLASALAWNSLVKKTINTFVKNKGGELKYHLMHALTVTLLTAVIFAVTKRILKPSITKQSVKPVVGFA